MIILDGSEDNRMEAYISHNEQQGIRTIYDLLRRRNSEITSESTGALYLSKILGVQEEQLEEILHDENAKVSRKTIANIKSLKSIADLIRKGVNDEAFIKWLFTNNGYLGDQKPVALLQRQDYDRVYDAAKEYILGMALDTYKPD
jgi:hypothetical protein